MAKPRLLVACEFSGTVRDAFAEKGWDAWSCDLLPCEKGGQHIEGDVLPVLGDGWDMMIAHPPCTYLCAGSMNWLYREKGRFEKMLAAVEFCRQLMAAPIGRIAMENPIGLLSSRLAPPSQVLHAWQFGHPFKKDICLWLKGLPRLSGTKLAAPPYRTFDFWSSARKTASGACKKSVTFSGVAAAMADQWSHWPAWPTLPLFQEASI